MSFDRDRLPDPVSYYQSRGLTLVGRGTWRTTACQFHGGSDSMRINTKSGGWCCMACGQSGGDVLAYELQATGASFQDAARALGAWIDDGKPEPRKRPEPLPPRQALEVLSFEAKVVAIAAADLANGKPLTDDCKRRLFTAAGRVHAISGAYK